MGRLLNLMQSGWRRFQLRHVLLMTVFLFIVGEEYPFSNFPMYSKLDDESDVLFITDQQDQPLPIQILFGTSSSTQKKVYMAELRRICNAHQRDSREALPEEQRQAGEKMLEKLMPRLKLHRWSEYSGRVTTLRVYHKIFTLEDGHVVAGKPVLIAERPL